MKSLAPQTGEPCPPELGHDWRPAQSCPGVLKILAKHPDVITGDTTPRGVGMNSDGENDAWVSFR